MRTRTPIFTAGASVYLAGALSTTSPLPAQPAAFGRSHSLPFTLTSAALRRTDNLTGIIGDAEAAHLNDALESLESDFERLRPSDNKMSALPIALSEDAPEKRRDVVAKIARHKAAPFVWIDDEELELEDEVFSLPPVSSRAAKAKITRAETAPFRFADDF